jgi:lipopolysaccharide exporter
LSFGLYQVGDRFANYLASRSDQILIGAFLGPEVLGYYTFAWNTVVQPVYRINPILNRVFAPILARIQDDLPRLRRGFLTLIGLTAMVNMPLIAGFAAIAPILVPTLFGPQWVPAVPILQILAMVAAVKAVGNPTGALVVATGRPDLTFRWSVAGTAFQFPILWWSAQYDSVLIVTATLAALQLSSLVGLYLFVHRPLLGPCLGTWLRQIGIPVVFATVMAAVVAYAASALDLGNPLKLLIGIALGVLIYSGLYGILQRRAIIDLTRIAIAR